MRHVLLRKNLTVKRKKILDHIKNSGTVSLRRSTVWNAIGSITPMLIGLGTVPYLMRQIGVERFGILTLIWALIGYFGIFDFGIGRALTQQVSANRKVDTSVMRGVVKAGLLLTLLFGVAGGALLATFAPHIGAKWFNVSVWYQKTTMNSLVITALGIPLTTFTAGLKGVLEGYEDFKTANILRVLLGIGNFGLPVLTVAWLGPCLEYIVASLVMVRLIILFAHLLAVKNRVPGWMQSRELHMKTVLGLVSFGAWMTVSNIISPLMVTSDRFIISYVSGAKTVAFYTVPFDVIIRFLVIPASLTSALFPRFSFLYSSNEQEVARLYRKSLTIIFLMMLSLCLFVGTGSYWGLLIWLGRDFAQNSWPIASILAVGLLFNSMAQIPHAAIQAYGDVRATSLLHLGEAILYVPALFLALRFFGLTGAASVWVLRVLADYLALTFLAKVRIAAKYSPIQVSQ